MKLHRFLGWRFMWQGTERGRLSPLTVFAWGSIAVGVAAMSCLLSVMYGFEGALVRGVLNAYPHIIVRSKDPNVRIQNFEEFTRKWQGVEGVKKVTPVLESEMIVQTSRRALGAVVWGLSRADMERFQEGLNYGKLPEAEGEIPQVILGSELAYRLGIVSNDRLKLISPIKKTGALGVVPQSGEFEVSGVFTSGHYEFDQQYLFLLMEDAQDLLGAGNSISAWHIWGKDLNHVDSLKEKLSPLISSELQLQTWKEFNSALFHSLQLEQFAMGLLLSLAVLIAVMNIMITLLMHVTHKRKNIGILRALGASQDLIQKTFLWQGGWMGIVGLTIGTLLSILFYVYIKYFADFQLPQFYYDRSLPIEVRPWSIIIVYLIAVILIYLASILPARRAAIQDPIDAIRE